MSSWVIYLLRDKFVSVLTLKKSSLVYLFNISRHKDTKYDYRTKTMFGSSVPPVVCRRANVLFTLFVFSAYSGVQHILFWALFCLSSSFVPYIASLSGL